MLFLLLVFAPECLSTEVVYSIDFNSEMTQCIVLNVLLLKATDFSKISEQVLRMEYVRHYCLVGTNSSHASNVVWH